MRIIYVIISLSFLISKCFTITKISLNANQCLDNNQRSIVFSQGPSPITTMLLKKLKDKNLKATFMVDPEILSRSNMSTLLKSMIDDGHLIGISLNEKSEVLKMSQDGLLGVIASYDDAINHVIGKIPVLVGVPEKISESAINTIGDDNHHLISLSIMREILSDEKKEILTENIKSKFKSNKGVIWVNENKIKDPEIMVDSLIQAVQDSDINITRLDECIGMQNPYKSEKITRQAPNIKADIDDETNSETKENQKKINFTLSKENHDGLGAKNASESNIKITSIRLYISILLGSIFLFI